ncbi:hypothetical protein HDU97_008672 [Phlyctochytrium planicorne]|nr:hypothetical protein HDU97_008672 [Phlyctochytrium planicorne]
MRFFPASILALACAIGVSAQSIIEALGKEDDLKTLLTVAGGREKVVAALNGLTDAVTLFAPSNAAFAKLAAAPSGDALDAVLFYHVVPGTSYVPKEDGRTTLKTALAPKDKKAAQVVVAAKTADGVTIGYRLAKANVKKSITVNGGKGIIHVVDDVLLPPQTIAETATAGGLTSLVDTIKAVGLLDVVVGLQDVTIFAPTNDAFAAIKSVTDTLSKEAIQDVLKLHIVPSPVYAGDIIKAGKKISAKTVLGQEVSAEATEKGVQIAGKGNKTPATVVIADVIFDEGVVHVVNTVLLPGAPETTTVAPTSTATAYVPTTTSAAAPKKTDIVYSAGAANLAPASFVAGAAAVAALFL